MGFQRYGKLQRGNVGSFEFGVYSLAGGINVKDVPEMIGDDDLVQALNGYLKASGGFQMRNGMTTHGTAAGSGPVDGLARFYQQVQGGTNVVPITKQTLKQVAGHLWDVDAGTDYGDIGGTDAMPWTTVRVADPDDSNYPGGPTDVLVICTGAGGPYVWDGVNLYTPAGWSDATDARWCTLVNGVVWFGGIPTSPQTIYGTGDGVIDSMETLPAYNVFVMSQPVTGLCAYGTGASAALVIGMNRGKSTLYGTGPNTYVLQDVPSEDGTIGGRTMIFNDGVVFDLGRQAFYAFNGQSPPIRISDKIEPWVLNDGFTEGYPITGDRLSAFSFIYDNRLHFGYESNGEGKNNTLLVFDLVTNGWTVLRTTPGLNCACLLDAPGDASPAVCVVGSSTDSQCYTWDVEPGGQLPATDAGDPITTTFQTKFFKVGVPGTNKALSRLYPEFFISGPMDGQLFVSTDYGTTTNAEVVAPPIPSTGGVWDTAVWDAFVWGSGNPLVPFVAPASRVDFDGIQGEAFSFGFTTFATSAPWEFGGLSAVAQQRGRT